MKSFEIPINYYSELISSIKEKRKEEDKLKKDFSPTLLDLGKVQIYLARHFGFCYGVENAIEIAFTTIEENPKKNIFLLSEMIHNPQVNDDLTAKGVKFLHDTNGNELQTLDNLSEEDIVLIPAFGTTIEIETKLKEKNIYTKKYSTTCPFVERVWNKAESISAKDFTVIIHGKPNHEETRATFSHAMQNGAAVVIKDMQQAKKLAAFVLDENKTQQEFEQQFARQFSKGFSINKDLNKIGVVNQTTMLASDTKEIAEYLKEIIIQKNNLTEENVGLHFADTRDTLCYATNDNQTAVYEMLKTAADLAFVVGGYNSSNTSHLVELCEEKLPTFFISNAEKIISKNEIHHFDLKTKQTKISFDFFPEREPVKILITSGASCSDSLVEGVIKKIAMLFNVEEKLNNYIKHQIS